MEKKKKFDPLKLVNNFIKWCEKVGITKETGAFLHDYSKDYPEFKILEENYEIIQQECLALLAHKEEITDMDGLGGERTKGGIHAIKWKTFMFKSGDFLEENCAIAPETAKLLKSIPRIKQAFFSILDPNQHIKPHTGYYMGFLRYHLGVVIPENNANHKCWIRINDNPQDNANYDKSKMANGEKYFWKNGKGIMFNDNYLHEAANETNEIRVVLFMDVIRKFPSWLDWLNRLFISIAYQTKEVKQIAKNAKVAIKEKQEEVPV